MCPNLELVFSQLPRSQEAPEILFFALGVGHKLTECLASYMSPGCQTTVVVIMQQTLLTTELFITMPQPQVPCCHVWKLCMYCFTLVNKTKYKKMCSIPYKNVVSSQFWQVEIHDQDLKRFSSQWSRALFLVCRWHFLTVCYQDLIFVCEKRDNLFLLLRTLVLQD